MMATVENLHHDCAGCIAKRGRPWTGGDYLGSKGYANSNRVAAVTRVIHCLNEQSSTGDASFKQQEEIAEAYSKEIEQGMSILGICPAIVIGPFCWVAAMVPQESQVVWTMATEVREGGGTANSRHVRRLAGLERGTSNQDLSLKKNTMVDRWYGVLLFLRLIEASLDDEMLTKIPNVRDEDAAQRLIKRIQGRGKRKGAA
jgi:hypothetical protein